ncbi:low molecular weight protein tyrosine phosphatase family protein [Granulosicoccus antarcticus]|nr:hypothetical protein [Granulosicoccus antarcticus]
MNLLFICSRNKWRSPTAEETWRREAGYNARSAGTSPSAKRTVSAEDIRWADIVFVMEKKHKNILTAKFTRMLDHKAIHILDIPDEYKYMDQELVSELEDKVGRILKTQ